MRPTPDGSARSRILGDRIAELRCKAGFTQQELAERVAISRVALSNIELARNVPGERTVVLLAGVFDMEPLELVADSGYPVQKAERLPLITARHTEVDRLLGLMESDFRWCEEFPEARTRVMERWVAVLSDLASRVADRRERDRIAVAATALRRDVGTCRMGPPTPRLRPDSDSR